MDRFLGAGRASGISVFNWFENCFKEEEGEIFSEERGRTALHETGIALAIYRQARQCLETDSDRLEWVEVAIGELSAVDPELLRLAWEAVVGGGPDAGTELRIDWRPARQYCPHCDRLSERPAPGWLRLCDLCSSTLLVSGGDELDLRRVSYQSSTSEALLPASEVP